MYCKKCGANINENSKFCASCGQPIENTVVQPQLQQKPKTLKVLPFIIIGVVLLIIIGIATILMLVGKGLETSKKPITSTEFRNKMQEKNYIIKDVTSQYSNLNYINKIYLAISDDNSYQIEFYDLVDDEHAKTIFENNMNKFKKDADSGNLYSYVNLESYSKYSQETRSKYQVISRIKNTAVYANVSSKYNAEVKEVIEEIGY